MKKDNSIFVGHILESIKNIEEYIGSANFSNFETNKMMNRAVIRELEIIGEASNRLDEDFRKQHSELPWREIKAFRNKVLHEYFGVRLIVVWDTLQEDLPVLKKALQQASE